MCPFDQSLAASHNDTFVVFSHLSLPSHDQLGSHDWEASDITGMIFNLSCFLAMRGIDQIPSVQWFSLWQGNITTTFIQPYFIQTSLTWKSPQCWRACPGQCRSRVRPLPLSGGTQPMTLPGPGPPKGRGPGGRIAESRSDPGRFRVAREPLNDDCAPSPL